MQLSDAEACAASEEAGIMRVRARTAEALLLPSRLHEGVCFLCHGLTERMIACAMIRHILFLNTIARKHSNMRASASRVGRVFADAVWLSFGTKRCAILSPGRNANKIVRKVKIPPAKQVLLIPRQADTQPGLPMTRTLESLHACVQFHLIPPARILSGKKRHPKEKMSAHSTRPFLTRRVACPWIF